MTVRTVEAVKSHTGQDRVGLTLEWVHRRQILRSEQTTHYTREPRNRHQRTDTDHYVKSSQFIVECPQNIAELVIGAHGFQGERQELRI
jgi:hypothetical protein